MSHTQYHSDTGNFTACMGYTGQEVGDGDGAGRPGLTSWRAASGCPDGETTALHALAAGIRSGVSPLQFKAGIVAGNEQMGNRAFLRWVEGLQAGGQDRNTLEITPPGMQGRESSLTDIVPLQLMSKRRKKKGYRCLRGPLRGYRRPCRKQMRLLRLNRRRSWKCRQERVRRPDRKRSSHYPGRNPGKRPWRLRRKRRRNPGCRWR